MVSRVMHGHQLTLKKKKAQFAGPTRGDDANVIKGNTHTTKKKEKKNTTFDVP